jgi:RNA polymerase-interacting CarD/CdnL/TRCF family regulator
VTLLVEYCIQAEVSDQHTVTDIVELLQRKFGADHQAVRHQATLDTLQRGSMSIEKLGRVVRDLMNKGFPGPWNTMKEQIARDKFLRAFGDAEMHRQFMT